VKVRRWVRPANARREGITLHKAQRPGPWSPSRWFVWWPRAHL